MDSPAFSTIIELVPDFGRYSSALRRLWWAIAAIAVCAAAASVALSGSSGSTTAVRFAVDQLDHEVSLDNPLGYTPPRRRVTEQGAALLTAEVWTRVKKAAPSARRPEVRSNDATNTLTIVVPGSGGIVDATVNAYIAELTTLRRDAVTKAAQAPLAVGAELLAKLSDDIKALDVAPGVGVGSTVDAALALQRAELVRQRADIERAVAVLHQVPEAADAGVQRLSYDMSKVARIPRAVLSGVGGALLAVVGVFVAAFVDRRVRRRVDVDRALGSGAFLGAIRRAAGDPELAAAGRAVREVADGGPVLLVGVAGYDARPLASTLNGFLEDAKVTATAALGSDSAVLNSISRGGTVVLVAADGASTELDLAAAAHVVSRAGGSVRGVLLVDTRRELGHVLA